MEKEELEVGSPVAVAGITLIPIARVSLNCWRVKDNLSFFGAKQPVGVVAIFGLARKAFRITGEEVPLEQLIKEVPGIKVTLDGISSS